MSKEIESAKIPVESLIITIRGQKVIVASDLARLYGVATKVLNQAVRRNIERFPEDFVFQLTIEEKQEVVTNCDHLENLKYSATLPYVFTEHGTVMAANLLNSPKAVDVSVYIVRAFVELRKAASLQQEILRRLAELEKNAAVHGQNISTLAEAIQILAAPSPVDDRKHIRVGFHWEEAKEASTKNCSPPASNLAPPAPP